MSEEWFTGKNPMWMHHYMGLNRWYASERRYRLLVAGILRRFWPLIKDECSRKMVAAVEDFADRQINSRKLLSARDEATEVDLRGEQGWLANVVASAGWETYDSGFFQSGILINQMVETFSHTRQITDVFRDVVQYRGMDGEYVPYTRPQPWRTKQVKLLARAAYDARSACGVLRSVCSWSTTATISCTTLAVLRAGGTSATGATAPVRSTMDDWTRSLCLSCLTRWKRPAARHEPSLNT